MTPRHKGRMHLWRLLRFANAGHTTKRDNAATTPQDTQATMSSWPNGLTTSATPLSSTNSHQRLSHRHPRLLPHQTSALPASISTKAANVNVDAMNSLDEHLPECRAANSLGYSCICPWLHACEQRVAEQYKDSAELWQDGYDTALNTVHDAIAVWDYGGPAANKHQYDFIRGIRQALNTIDSMLGKPLEIRDY